MKSASVFRLRHLFRNRPCAPLPLFSSLAETPTPALTQSPAANKIAPSSMIPSRASSLNFPVATAVSARVQLSYLCRNLCTSSSGLSNIVFIESDEKLKSSFSKAEDESLPAIFYFTAAWCGPCKFLSPIFEKLAEKYPHVTTYKIDIDQEGLGNTFKSLHIHSVPTIYFYQNGKKAAEIIGANAQCLENTMEKLYK